MRCNSECFEIKVIIIRSGLLFKDVKICLWLLITDTKYLTLFQGNHHNRNNLNYAVTLLKPKLHMQLSTESYNRSEKTHFGVLTLQNQDQPVAEGRPLSLLLLQTTVFKWDHIDNAYIINSHTVRLSSEMIPFLDSFSVHKAITYKQVALQ